MDLRELTYITVVAETGNISKAAGKLFISQPSLSRWIQKIETDLGVELFKRIPGGLKITVAGEFYVSGAYKILQAYREMENQVSRVSSMQAGRITIGTTNFLGSFILPAILFRFHKIYPGIDISIVEGNSTDIESDVLKGSVDLGILHTPLITNTLEYRFLLKEEFLLAVSPDDDLNDRFTTKQGDGKKYIDLCLTADRTYISTYPFQRIRQITEQILKASNIPFRIKFETKSIQTASRLAAAGLGLTLVPSSYSALFSNRYAPNYYHVSEELNPYWSLVACYNTDIPLSKPAEEMLRIALETIPCLYEEK